eukprot:jgi/Chlat1/981/Chrsp108S01401
MFRADFSDFSLLGQHTIKAKQGESNAACQARRVELSDVDASYLLRQFSMAWVLLFDYALDAVKLVTAVQRLVEANPILAGRFVLNEQRNGRLTLACCNAGVPLTIASWPQGSIDAFPTALEATYAHGAARATPPLVPGIDLGKLEKGLDAPVKFQLTYLADGDACALAINCSHALSDAKGMFALLCKDLAQAFKGEVVEPVSEDRAFVSAIELLKGINEDLKAAVLATVNGLKTAVQAEASKAPLASDHVDLTKCFSPTKMHGTNERESAALRLVSWHVPNQQLATLRAHVNNHCFAYGVEQVSTNDVIVALIWMLRCHIYDLTLPGTLFFMTEDLRSSLPSSAVPENYFGNATAMLQFAQLLPEAAKESQQEESNLLHDMLVRVAATVRSVKTASRNLPTALVNALASNAFQTHGEWGAFQKVKQLQSATLAVIVIIFLETLIGVDFGRGGPKMLLGAPSTESRDANVVGMNGISLIVNAANEDGVVVQLFLDEPNFSLKKDDGFLRQLAPQAKFL